MISAKSFQLIVVEKSNGPHFMFHKYDKLIFLASYALRAYKSPINAYNFAIGKFKFVLNTQNASYSVYSLTCSKIIDNADLTLPFMIFHLAYPASPNISLKYYKSLFFHC